jgi:iron complex outermembrane receptor protein
VGRDGGWASARSQAGAAQSDFSNAGGGGGGAFSQLNSISLRGGSSSRSGGIAATVKGIGAFVPDAFSRQVSATGGGRLVGAKGILTGTARFFAQDAGAPLSPLLADTTFGMLDSTSLAQQLSPRTQSVRQYTFGATGNVVAGERWTHAATLGLDGYRLAGVDDDLIPIPTVADAGVRAAHSSGDRATLRVSSVTQQPVGKQALLGLTFAAEHSVLFERSDEPAMVAWQPGAPVRPALADVSSSWSNSGLIAQANLSLRDTWYFSAGARAERNGGFDVEQTTLLPMLGAAWVHELAGATVKLRSAFGKGIRPQRTATRESTWVGTHRHGTARSLAPEEQSGIEAGIDVFLGRALSLQVTRFDQLASGLIQRVTLGADTSARSRRGPRAIGYAMQNVGEITNRGWELEGGVRAGALTLNGTLALVDSRVRQTAAGYSGDLRAGDRMLEVPSRTTSLSARWTRSGWNLSAGATRAADWINYDRLGLAWAVVNGEHPEPQYIGGWLRGFWDTYDGVTRVRASITRDIGRNLSLQLSGDNLLGEQLGEPDNVTVLPGRLISLGVRLQR